MTRLLAACAAAVALTGAAAAQEITMSGLYQTPDGEVTMEFGADGRMSGLSPTGVQVTDTFVIEDGVYTVTAAGDHPVCPGAVGVYTLSESDGVITMTLVSDECDLRAQGLDGGQWVKAESAE